MIIFYITLGIIAYLVIGRVLAEKYLNKAGRDPFGDDGVIMLITGFWPISIIWAIVHIIAGLFIHLED